MLRLNFQKYLINYNLTIYEFADFPLEDDIIQKNYANEPALITNFYEDENNFYYKYFYRVTKDFFIMLFISLPQP